MSDSNKWETAIRCLEVALHPHTSDDEIIAGVNGFRRTAGGTSLHEILFALAATPGNPRGAEVEAASWRRKWERLDRDHRALQRRCDKAERDHALTLRRLTETERRQRELDAQLQAAQRRAAEAEEAFVDLRAAVRPRQPPRSQAANPAPAPPFKELLSAARHRTGFERSTVMDLPPHVASPQGTPWTA
ncbi:MAG: hypothetical protein ACREFD_15290 [Stellaceae bacterium]